MIMKNAIPRNLWIASLLAAGAEAAFCQGVVYTLRPAFEAALSSSTTITFEDLPSTRIGGLGESSITTSGVTFTSPSALLFVTKPGGLYYPIPGTGKYLWQFDGGYPVNSLLPDGVTAFGADFSGGIEPKPSYNATVTVNLASGQTYAYNFTGPRGAWTFFGVTFEQAIASVVYDDGGSRVSATHEEMLDNVTFGVIPEPSALGLLALGGLLLDFRLRRNS